jgi:hypothetical protein
MIRDAVGRRFNFGWFVLWAVVLGAAFLVMCALCLGQTARPIYPGFRCDTANCAAHPPIKVRLTQREADHLAWLDEQDSALYYFRMAESYQESLRQIHAPENLVWATCSWDDPPDREGYTADIGKGVITYHWGFAVCHINA